RAPATSDGGRGTGCAMRGSEVVSEPDGTIDVEVEPGKEEEVGCELRKRFAAELGEQERHADRDTEVEEDIIVIVVVETAELGAIRVVDDDDAETRPDIERDRCPRGVEAEIDVEEVVCVDAEVAVAAPKRAVEPEVEVEGLLRSEED